MGAEYVPDDETKILKSGDVMFFEDQSGGDKADLENFLKTTTEDSFNDPVEDSILEKAMTGAATAESKQQETPDFTGYSFYDVVEPRRNLKALAALYTANSTHGAAVRAKVANIVGLGYEWHENDDARKILQDLEDNSEQLQAFRTEIATQKATLNAWLDSTNNTDEFIEVLRKVWTDVETTGNGYLEIGRKLNGEIGYIGHIQSYTMRIRRKRDGFVQIIGHRPVFFRNFGDTATLVPFYNKVPNEVIHFKKYDPTDPFYGVPDIVAAENAVLSTEFADRYNQDFFENKAVPRYIVVVTGGKISEAQENELIDFFNTELKGNHHRTMYVNLSPDSPDSKPEFKIEPVEAKIQDVSFVKLYTKNRDEVLMADGVPITKVMSLTGGVSLAAARDMDKTFKEQVCRPEQTIIESKLRKIFNAGNKAVWLKFHLTEMTLSDEDTLSKIDERYWRMGVKVSNEIRQQRFGWKGLEGGDERVHALEKPDRAAETTAQASGNRQRDQARQANSPDRSGEGRATQGEGRQQA